MPLVYWQIAIIHHFGSRTCQFQRHDEKARSDPYGRPRRVKNVSTKNVFAPISLLIKKCAEVDKE